MRTIQHEYDIEDHGGHHAVRQHRAETRGSSRRQAKQTLSHLTHTAMMATAFGEEDDILQFAGALPAEVTVE